MKKINTYQSYQTLVLNGFKHEGKGALTQLAKNLLNIDDEEKKHIGGFILDWVSDKDTVTLQTSGSTGVPKQITVKKDSMVASAQRTLKFLELKPESSSLLCLSAKYIAGKMMLVRAMVGHLKLFTTPVNSNPLKSYQRKFDFAAMVPMQVDKILREDSESLDAVRHLIIGGGSVSSQVSEKLREFATNSWETYGMTETVSHIALRNIKDNDAGFQLLPGLSIDIDERNCLVVEPSDINENRLITNDIVEIISDNEFILKGRFDNIINTGGVKVVAEEIERKLCPFVRKPYAISWRRDDVLGQRVVLVCESKEPVTIDDVDQTILAKYEFPKEVICVKTIPRTETGKIQRRKLQQLIDK
ncbi:MAG: AMP-binding protein [Bacteroidales bacterium]|nr:AMP-binding protein [Bacteroidales bacterium]